jgi:diguanylate cyclase (GGDEF)-like protein
MKRHIDARVTYAVAGAILALGAPVGWRIINSIFPEASGEPLLYGYLTGSTLLVFAAFGSVLGHLFERIRALAVSDPLTGLLNQSSFRQTAEILRELAIRHDEAITVIMIDIDNFKRVNDDHSHLLGSQVIKDIATILKAHVRTSDLVARFGGDEFIVLLPRTLGDDAANVAERIRVAVEKKTFRLGRDSVRVTLSIGIACHAHPKAEALPLNDLIALADRALYTAKNEGRNRVVVLGPDTPRDHDLRSTSTPAPGTSDRGASAKGAGGPSV